jgi:P-type Cu+ transporter
METKQASETSSALERDPVCGMQVDPAKARARAEHAGRTYFFCCDGCAQKFRAAPDKYLAPLPKPAGPSLVVLTPGPAGKLPSPHPLAPPVPLAAVPAKAKAPAAPVEYTCPMDLQIVQLGPGSCPICGMALEFLRGSELQLRHQRPAKRRGFSP